MISLTFLKDILSGKKSLLRMDEVKIIPRIPKIPEVDVKQLWLETHKEPKLSQYFPAIYISSGRVSNRNYYFTV